MCVCACVCSYLCCLSVCNCLCTSMCIDLCVYLFVCVCVCVCVCVFLLVNKFIIVLSFTLSTACRTRSSAQGNCSAKSLAGYVIDSSLSSLSSTSYAVHKGGLGGRGSGGRGGLGRGRGVGEGVKGRGQGTFYPLCHTLHDHMVLRPEGTSHNQQFNKRKIQWKAVRTPKINLPSFPLKHAHTGCVTRFVPVECALRRDLRFVGELDSSVWPTERAEMPDFTVSQWNPEIKSLDLVGGERYTCKFMEHAVGVSECPGCLHSALLTRMIIRVKTTQDQGQKVNIWYSKQHTTQHDSRYSKYPLSLNLNGVLFGVPHVDLLTLVFG